jgi:hypothetical protein
MIAVALKVQIERYAAEMPSSNPLYFMAANGELTNPQIARYLANIRYLLDHTLPLLTRAIERSTELGRPDLVAHYRQKLDEEVGHELWADRDLRRVGATLSSAPLDVVPAMHETIAFVERIIDEDPTLYLSYILLAEYLIVLLGPRWLVLLEERCGIPRTSMTVIGNHAELDRAHVEEAFERIDELVLEPTKLPRMREVLAESIQNFARFCEEVTNTQECVRHGSDRYRSAEQPAA